MNVEQALRTIIQQNDKLSELLDNVGSSTEYDDTELRNLIKENSSIIEKLTWNFGNFLKPYDWDDNSIFEVNDLGDIIEILGGDMEKSLPIRYVIGNLHKLGANYKNLYNLASTVKNFLESKDVADSTINTWLEIQEFLEGINDDDSLLKLLNSITTEIEEINNRFPVQTKDIKDANVTLEKLSDNLKSPYTYKNSSELDNLKTPGIYNIKATSPEGVNLISILSVVALENEIIQTHYGVRNNNIIHRRFVNNAWTEWTILTIAGDVIQHDSITKEHLNATAKLQKVELKGRLNNVLSIQSADVTKTCNLENNKSSAADGTYNNFGNIYYTKNDNSGKANMILIADCTSLFNNNNDHSPYGFKGILYLSRTGYNRQSCAFITAIASYDSNGITLQTSNDSIIPYIVTYNDKYYVAIVINDSGYKIRFEGFFYNILDNFIQLNGTDASAKPIIEGVEYYRPELLRNYYLFNASYAKNVASNSISLENLTNELRKRTGCNFVDESELDDIVKTGTYIVKVKYKNTWTIGNIMTVISISSTQIRQTVHSLTSGTLKYRVKEPNVAWTSWMDVLVDGGKIIDGSITNNKLSNFTTRVNTRFYVKDVSGNPVLERIVRNNVDILESTSLFNTTLEDIKNLDNHNVDYVLYYGDSICTIDKIERYANKTIIYFRNKAASDYLYYKYIITINVNNTTTIEKVFDNNVLQIYISLNNPDNAINIYKININGFDITENLISIFVKVITKETNHIILNIGGDRACIDYCDNINHYIIGHYVIWSPFKYKYYKINIGSTLAECTAERKEITYTE